MITADKLATTLAEHIQERRQVAATDVEETGDDFDKGRLDAFEEVLRLMTTVSAMVNEKPPGA